MNSKCELHMKKGIKPELLPKLNEKMFSTSVWQSVWSKIRATARLINRTDIDVGTLLSNIRLSLGPIAYPYLGKGIDVSPISV